MIRAVDLDGSGVHTRKVQGRITQWIRVPDFGSGSPGFDPPCGQQLFWTLNTHTSSYLNVFFVTKYHTPPSLFRLFTCILIIERKMEEEHANE